MRTRPQALKVSSVLLQNGAETIAWLAFVATLPPKSQIVQVVNTNIETNVKYLQISTGGFATYDEAKIDLNAVLTALPGSVVISLFGVVPDGANWRWYYNYENRVNGGYRRYTVFYQIDEVATPVQVVNPNSVPIVS